MMFLSENIDLLRTIVDLIATLLQLSLMSDVFYLQLFVLLLQQSHPLVIL